MHWSVALKLTPTPLRFRSRVALPSSRAKYTLGQKREKPNERHGWRRALLPSTTRSASVSSESRRRRPEQSFEQYEVRSREIVLLMRAVASSGDIRVKPPLLTATVRLVRTLHLDRFLSTPARALFRFQSIFSGNLKFGLRW